MGVSVLRERRKRRTGGGEIYEGCKEKKEETPSNRFKFTHNYIINTSDSAV